MCWESEGSRALLSVDDRGHCTCSTCHTTVFTATLPFFHIYIFLRQMNLPVSLPSASKYTIASVLLRIASGRWTGTKGVPTFSVLSGKEIAQIHPKALLQDGTWGINHSAHETEGWGEARTLKIPDLMRLCQDGGKKRKMTNRLSYSNTASKRGGIKYLTTLFSLLFYMFENTKKKKRNQNKSQYPIRYKPEKLFQNGNNEWLERPGAPD